MTASASELSLLKERMKAIWMAGDYAQVAKQIESCAEEFIGRLGIERGTRMLDVACGNGNLAIAAARQGAVVTGVDIAANLVEAARRRTKAEELEIRFEEGDAEQLPYPDGAFDLVVSMFGAMFAPRPELVAAELVRVCRSGGRIAMANWTAEGFAGQMFRVSGKHVPPPNIPPPVLWGNEQTVRERLRNGIARLVTTRRRCVIHYSFPPAEVVEFFRTYFGPTQAAFAALDGRGQQALRADLEQLWTEHNQATDGTTLVESEYLEVIAVRS